MQKKVWKTPKLVVLVRGKPEEAVLAFCKSRLGIFFLGPNNEDACVNQELFPCNEAGQT